ncbi:MAG: SpoIID/LytB domain-containing protein [Clostridiales bacterium]|nr:SpoIID/LytB domain-containing protein [Clostridiales bacterium]
MTFVYQKATKAALAVLMILMILCGILLPGIEGSRAEDGIATAPHAIDPIVRVLLSRLNITDRMDVTLTAPYGLHFGTGNAEMYFEKGSQLAFLLRNDVIYLYYQGMSLRCGSQVQLKKYADQNAQPEERSGFYLTNFDPLYQGDLSLSVTDGKIRPILSIHVEDYLLGVVPYEMNDLFPVEALKAQTVAARTYALRKKNAAADYDVVDTTNDQVFRGYVPGNTHTEQAIKETYGVCGFYKGKLAQCYYSASNGGQTELVESVWKTDGDFSYYAFGKDPYDVENPASTVRSFPIRKEYKQSEVAPFGLRKLLADMLFDELTQLGFDPSPESIQVHQVSEVKLDTPSSRDSAHLTMLHMTVRISGRTRSEAKTTITLEDLDTEEVFLFETLAPITPNHTPTPTPAPTAAIPTPTPELVYGPFTPIEEAFVLDIPIFPSAENAFGMNISTNYDNEIWALVEDQTGYEIQARRYGHGVGMSQRGAEWMALTYEKDFKEILGFYYPGMKLMRYDFAAPVPPVPEAELAATAGPAPTVTPRPTLMPVTMNAAPGQWYAVVTGIAEDSTLNLRSRPDLGGDILMRLYKNQRLLVLQRCPEEGWVQVQTDAITGYVMESFLTEE